MTGPAAPQSDCSYACMGNNSQTCGGFDRMSIYQDPTFPKVSATTISDYIPQGCYSEGTFGRAVAFPQDIDALSITAEACLQICKNGNFPMAATEYGSE